MGVKIEHEQEENAAAGRFDPGPRRGDHRRWILGHVHALPTARGAWPFGLSLRDDFDIDAGELVIIKAALTHQQAQELDLHEGQIAKELSARRKRFVDAYGDRCWELEAIPTDTLRDIVDGTIQRTIDMEAFQREVDKQAAEQGELDEHRWRVRDLLSEMDWAGGPEA